MYREEGYLMTRMKTKKREQDKEWEREMTMIVREREKAKKSAKKWWKVKEEEKWIICQQKQKTQEIMYNKETKWSNGQRDMVEIIRRKWKKCK